MKLFNLSGGRHTPLTRQSEAAECGLACIAMIAGAHGLETNLTTLRQKYPISMMGARLSDLIKIASDVGFGARPVQCDVNEIPELKTPAILHWGMNHFVVLVKANRQNLVIHDPAIGKRVISFADVDKQFTGIALELTPSANFRKKKERNPVRLFSLLTLGNAGRIAIIQIIAVSLAIQLFDLLSPFYMQLVIDEAILNSNSGLLAAIAIGFLILKVFEAGSDLLRGLVSQYLSVLLRYNMGASLVRHLLRLPVSYFHRRHIGDIQQRFLSLDPIREFIANGAILGLIDGVFSIALCIMIFLYDVVLGFVILGFIAAYIALRIVFLNLQKRLSGDWLLADAKENSKFLESLRAIQEIKITGTEIGREILWRNCATETLNAQIKMGNVQIGFNAINRLLMGLSNILVVYLAATKSIGGAMSVGMITALIAYKGRFEQRIINLVEQLIQFKLLDVHLERVSDIALEPSEVALTAPPFKESFSGEVELRNVHFKYGAYDAPILTGVSCILKPGSFTALTSVSGAGKSTLLKVILGLYPPSSGQVLYDGFEAKKWGLNSLRQQMGVVMQDGALLSGTVQENIANSDENPDLDRVKEVAELACIHNEIMAMPMGYHTLVGDMGSALSGGQQQRILLARALYRKPSVLVMDEGTSHLDVETERLINENLKSLKITRLVAAHRRETIDAADSVLTIQNGRIVPLNASAQFASNLDDKKLREVIAERHSIRDLRK